MSGNNSNISRSNSTASVSSDASQQEGQPPTDPPHGKPKKERNALTHRLTKLNLFGRKRGKDTQQTPPPATSSSATLSEYVQQEQEPQSEDTISTCEEEGATILWEDDGNVKAATPVMLVRRITDEKFVDHNLMTDVIVSYLTLQVVLWVYLFSFFSFFLLLLCSSSLFLITLPLLFLIAFPYCSFSVLFLITLPLITSYGVSWV